MRNCVVTGNRMLDAGNVAAPLIWEHDLASDPTPLPALLSMIENPRQWAGDFARNTFGYSGRYQLETVKGDPVALAKLQVHSADDLDRFRKVRFVSARVNHNHTDPTGRFWPGWSIGHIAATPLPIQQRQRPVMLSHAPGGRRSWASVFLSREYREGETMPEPKKGEEGGKPEGSLSALLTELANAGLNIPDGVTDLDGVILSLKTINANGGPGGKPADAGPGDDDLDGWGDGAEPVSGGGMPALLSSLPDDAARAGYAAAVDNARAGLVRRFQRVEKRAVPDGHWTAAKAKQLADTFAKMDGVRLLSAVAPGADVSRAVRELTLLERHYGFSAAPTGAAVPNPSKVASKQLSSTPRGTVAKPAPDLGTPGRASDADIEAARARAKERIASKKATPAAT